MDTTSASTAETASQTAGPYLHIGCVPRRAGLAFPQNDLGTDLRLSEAAGSAITLDIELIDGNGEPVHDGMIEIWQADTRGHYVPNEDFSHWGRCATDNKNGRARFTTVKPGLVEKQAPHILLWIVARGINLGLSTRLYFPDDTTAHAGDRVLGLVGARARTLIATKTTTGYAHRIVLQGPDETVFFDV